MGLFLLVTLCIALVFLAEHGVQRMNARRGNTTVVPSTIQIVAGELAARIAAIIAALSYVLLFAAITGIEDWETPGGLGAALAFGGITLPALPVLVTRVIKIKRLVRKGVRTPYYLVERRHASPSTFGYSYGGKWYDSSTEPKAMGFFPATAVLNPKNPDVPFILEDLVRGHTHGTEVQSAVTEELATRFYHAIEDGDLATIERAVSERRYLEIEDYMGRTPLMFAAAVEDTKPAELLLSKGARPDRANARSSTPLMIACEKGNPAVAKLLLAQRLDVDAVDCSGETALMMAARLDHVDVVRLLAESGASLDLQDNDGVAALLRALHEGRNATAKALMDLGAAVDTKAASGWTPLLVAVGHGDAEMVGLLLARGASPRDSIRLRMRAEGDTSELKELVGLGTTVLEFDLSPLVLAAVKDYADVAAKLLDAGADRNEKLPNGSTLLKEATLTGRTAMMQLLMERGASS